MKLFNILLASALVLGATACDDDKNPHPAYVNGTETENPNTPENPEPGTEDSSSRNEQYRPQVHYTPAKNWTNDPNGMVYVDGVYHLYYQYNPQGNDWGNMSWGHATSTDLIHWEEKPVAMLRNEWGDIFSGSAVIDKDNTAGFGQGTMLAFYTGSGEHQQQCLAYSKDGGLTFTQYEGNPIIPNTVLGDFRDPKVIWHEASKQWVMSLALGWDHKIEFWGSKDAKNWEKLSTFTTDAARSNIGQWECPDLFPLQYKGQEKWVLIVSNNPGGPAGGSGIEYFIGDFDGKEFKAMDLAYPLWLDYGADNYAGVTWSNAPGDRKIMIGWMNNWNYCGNVPCSPWRSAFTLPHELKLVEINGSPILAAPVVNELDAIAGQWTAAADGNVGALDAYEAKFTVKTNENSTFRLENTKGQYLEFEVNGAEKMLIAKRTSTTGEVKFNNLFSVPSISAPLNCEGDEMEIHVVVDRSSVELFSADGATCMTNIVFPIESYTVISGAGPVEYRKLSSIW